VCDPGGGYPYFEVSAASGESVQEMFHTLFARVIDRVGPGTVSPAHVSIVTAILPAHVCMVTAISPTYGVDVCVGHRPDSTWCCLSLAHVSNSVWYGRFAKIRMRMFYQRAAFGTGPSDQVPGLPTDLMDAARALEMGAGIKRRR